MTFSLADVDASAAALREFAGADLAGLPRAELLRLQRLAAEGRRAWDVALASIAGEIARRSSADDNDVGRMVPGGRRRLRLGVAQACQCRRSQAGSSTLPDKVPSIDAPLLLSHGLSRMTGDSSRLGLG